MILRKKIFNDDDRIARVGKQRSNSCIIEHFNKIYGGHPHGKRGGFPGGMPGNMNNIMKQAQKMQRQMEEAQKALEEQEITAAAGGGAVEVTVSGKHEVVKVKLAEEVVDPDDIEMLEDLIMAATNEALRQVDEASQKSMSQITGGLGGGFPF